MKPYSLKFLCTLVLLLFNLTATAEDIDVFLGLASADDLTDKPNVLFVIDNSANFSASATHGCTYIDDSGNYSSEAPSLGNTTGGMEQCALYNVIKKQTPGSVKIGVMAFNANKFVDWDGKKCNAVTDLGGCLMVPITLLDANGKTAILDWIKRWENSTETNPYLIKTNNKATGAIMQEAWAYLEGHTGISGTSYSTAKPANNICLKNNVVFIGNAYNSSGSPGDQSGTKGPKDALEGTNPVADKNATPVATTTQKTIYQGTVTTQCGTYTFPTNHENGGYYADEWARYMAAQNIATYTIGVYGTGCQAEYAALLSSMATFGDGKYFPTRDFSELEFAIGAILSAVQPVNSAFASVSLPVSVNTQGTYRNQVFIGMFRPDEDSLPRWPGNLKQYKMGIVGSDLKLLDAANIPAVASNTGFMEPCARSYWTPTTDDAYWNFSTDNCTGHSASSNTPDGNIVEKGAQGYLLRSVVPTARTVKTCGDSACSTLGNFDTSNALITAASLTPPSETSTIDTTERTAIINWVRGLNNHGDEFGSDTAMRPSVHGDVVHSRPVAIDYGTETTPQVVVFYGGNDGVLRAINGNRSTSILSGSVSFPAGTELWSFVAPESYPMFKRLRDDTTKISFPTSEAGLPKPYGIDGPIVAYKDSSQTLIFASMRRGGNALYAFDVTSPASPSLKWRFTDTNLGQTWSPPKALKASGYTSGGSPSPMLIVGGGYDTCEDSDPHSCASPYALKGNRIFVLDALTGTKLKEFVTDRGVIGEVFVVPDTDGTAKYAYAADLGGNIYRMSGTNANTPFGSTTPSNWTITKIASLGGSGTDARKFIFAPDVLDDNGTYILLIGSGDREKPLDISQWSTSNAVTNYFFMVKDKPADITWLTTENANCGDNVICKASLFPILTSTNPTPAQLASKPKGWYLGLNTKEQVVTTAITVFGVTTFSTHIPTDPALVSAATSYDQCFSKLGTASVYNINYADASAIDETRGIHYIGTDIGLAPSPVAGEVILDDGKKVPFIIGASPTSPLESKIPPAPTKLVRPKNRLYWYIQK